MHMPAYDGGSIVNLMSSIGRHFGAMLPYEPLESPHGRIRDGDTVVLIVIDGLGYEFLRTKGEGTVLFSHMRGRMTSVFPSTTSASLTTFATGVAPLQHAITGWFMHLKEVGMVLKILPFTPRLGTTSLTEMGIDPLLVFDQETMYRRLGVPAHYVVHEMFADSPYTVTMTQGAQGHYYTDLDGFADSVCEAATADAHSYVYAYWPRFDTLSHMHGVASAEAYGHFLEIDRSISRIIERLAGTKTTIIITADHGLIDVKEEDIVRLDDHPTLGSCLSQPICGEARAAYCYVHPSKAAAFETYVSEALGDVCTCVPSHEIVENGYYGRGVPHAALNDRVGDYILLMHDTHVLVDRLLGEPEHVMVGYHGGLSDGELFVPLITVQC